MFEGALISEDEEKPSHLLPNPKKGFSMVGCMRKTRSTI